MGDLGFDLSRNLVSDLGSDLAGGNIAGLSGWDTSTALSTANPGGIEGSAVTGVSVVIMWTCLTVPSTLQELAFHLSGNTGWWYISNGVALQARCGNGAAQAIGPQRNIVAADVNRIHISALSCDTTAVYHYFDRAQIGTSTALAGFSPASFRTTMGSSNVGASPAVDFAIFGICGRNSHLSLADYQTICDATKNNNSLSLGGISMDHHWVVPNQASVPTTISDSAGSDALSFIVGTAANLVVRRFNSWGF